MSRELHTWEAGVGQMLLYKRPPCLESYKHGKQDCELEAFKNINH